MFECWIVCVDVKSGNNCMFACLCAREKWEIELEKSEMQLLTLY